MTLLTLCYEDGRTETVTVYEHDTIEPAKDVLFRELPTLATITEEAL